MATQKALDPDQIEWAYTKICEGHSRKQVARALFVCERTLARALKGRKIVPIPLVYDRRGEEQHDRIY